MLILTRKEGQVVCIGNDVKITVLGIKSGQIRLGVDAPRDVTVHREEVKQRIDAKEPRRA